MVKNKYFLIFIVVLFINFCSNNNAFAIQDIEIKNRYPNYSYEFIGKDKWEKFNRKMFAFNLKANKCVLKPINIVWASIVPQYGMDRLQNAYNNIHFPVRFVSCLLQKDFKSSKSEAVRFLTNTTLGIGGLYDPAKTKFKIEPRKEDMGQVLAYHKVKPGPYLVLPIVAQGCIRDIIGKALDCPLNPCSYVGPFGAVANGVLLVNNTTYIQPLVKKIDDTFADPYEIAKEVNGVERYIKNSNLDRKEILDEKNAAQNIVRINSVSEISNIKTDLKPDVELNNFNPQSSLVDSMRTAWFDNQKIDDSIWSEMSIWNKTFKKRIKTNSVKVNKNRPDYEYRYILQKNKTSPLAIIYPSFGEGIMADKSIIQAKILYDEGYSVVIQGSAFQWEFVNSMPDNYRPGSPSQDAHYLRLVTAKIIDNLQKTNSDKSGGYSFNKKIVVGSSYGALTALFVAAQEDEDNTLGISNYIAINPPIELFFALKQLDKYSQDWKNDPSDIKMRIAITAQKIIQATQAITDNNVGKTVKIADQDKIQKISATKPEALPFNDEEAKLVIGFIMKQKLSDVVFAIEKGSRCKKTMIGKCGFYEATTNMSFGDYATKYLPEFYIANGDKSSEQLCSESSLYAINDFLKSSNNYKIYHSIDDYFVNKEQLSWLKKQTNNKSVLYSNGSHLGELYRQEFIDEFKKDIKL